MPWNLKFDNQVSPSQTGAKNEVNEDHDQNLLNSKGSHDTSVCQIITPVCC